MVFKAKKCEKCGWNTVYSASIKISSGNWRTWNKVGYFCIKCGGFEVDYTDYFSGEKLP